MKKVSIVVPTYNVEAYIRKCLDSLVAQDYANYDIWVINDGSPANEQVIIEEYASTYPMIHAVLKENGGYGSVLEYAFLHSDADYVLVCDPDDYLSPDAVSTLVKRQEESGAQLVVGAKYLVYSDNDEKVYDPSFNEEYAYLKDHTLYCAGEEGFNSLYYMEPSPHAKLYPLSLVKNIHFPHKVSYTDNLLYFYTLNNIQTVAYCSKAVSYYLIDRVGNTRTDYKATIIDSWVTVFNALLDQIKPNDAMAYRLMEAFYSIYYKIDNINASKQGKIDKYELLYSYLKRLIPYKDDILKMDQAYNPNEKVLHGQKEKLLSQQSLPYYRNLYTKRLNGSLKSRLKNLVEGNPLLSVLYSHYHFHAKYYKTRHNEKMILHPSVSATFIDEEGTNFFGYYDKPCVFNNKALYQKTLSNSLKYNQEMGIYIDGQKIGSTKAWNWQQGSMASWFDNSTVIYNDFDGTHYISKKTNYLTHETIVYPFPIYSLSKDRRFALSLNFSRLAKLRKDYGYFNLPYQILKSDKDDGIYYLDLNTKDVRLYMSLEEIKSFKPRPNMANAIHKVNHIDISPNSDKAIFLHRWFLGNKKYTRLLMVDIATKELHLLADQDMVSHMCWVNNDLLFGYLSRKDGKDGYAFIDTEGKETVFNHPFLVDDGHPTAYNDRYIVTDSYPDYTCMSKLFLIDRLSGEVTLLGRFYSGKRYQKDCRDDLHPRFDNTGKKLTIDTVCQGRRRVLHLDLSALIKEDKHD